jgi:disulfide oxidoreductase YuzD
VTKQVSLQKHCVNSPQMSGTQEIFSNLIKKQYKVEIFKKQYKIEILLKKQYKIASDVKDKIITLFRIKSDSCFQQM